MSFPTRPTRASFGPTLKNARPITNPNQQIPDSAFNALFWSVAGMAGLSPVAMALCTAVGGAIAIASHWEAWAPNGDGAAPTPVRTSAGLYTLQYAAQYPDETGAQQVTALSWGIIFGQGLGAAGKFLAPAVTKIDGRTFQIDLFRADQLAAGTHDDGNFLALFG